MRCRVSEECEGANESGPIEEIQPAMAEAMNPIGATQTEEEATEHHIATSVKN